MPIWYILATNGYVYAFTIGLKSFTRSRVEKYVFNVFYKISKKR